MKSSNEVPYSEVFFFFLPLQADQHHFSRRREPQITLSEEARVQPEETLRVTREEETTRGGETHPSRDHGNRQGQSIESLFSVFSHANIFNCPFLFLDIQRDILPFFTFYLL